MKQDFFRALPAVVALSLGLAGCGPSGTPPVPPSAPATSGVPVTSVTSTTAVNSARPGLDRTLSAWQAADVAVAMEGFLAADWVARPLFPSNSVLSLSEGQFQALSAGDREARSGEMLRQVDGLKRLAAAVLQTGREAAARGETAQARKCFTAVQQCGTALDHPESLKLVQMVGSSLRKVADAELARLAK